MKKYKVLVFPCGSECGLEIGRSLQNLKEVELWGASSVDDHGLFFFKNYEGGLPYISDPSVIEALNEIITRREIDFVYPAMDSVAAVLADAQGLLNAPVIGSVRETVGVALSKRKTYEKLSGVVRCPRMYEVDALGAVEYPLFLKPEIGYGSRGVVLARNYDDVINALKRDPSLLILEYLPGKEYTVDCFTDFGGRLLFSGMRERRRIARGISVNTTNVRAYQAEIRAMAERINETVPFNGAWFFQVKMATDGTLALLEIAPRIAGSMGLHRCMGVNLPLLSVFNQARMSVEIEHNDYDLEFDRAYYNRVKLSREFTSLYVDFDDCLLLGDGKLNAFLVMLIVSFRNKGRKVAVISRHRGELHERIESLGLTGLIDEIHHLRGNESKTDYMRDRSGILIDDSFAERSTAIQAGYAALGPESVEALLDN